MKLKSLAVLAATLSTLSMLAQPALAQSKEPIKVGFMTVRSGALAAGGKQMEDGIRLFLKERNGTLAGRDIKLVVADTGGQPAITKTRIQELVEKEKVNVVIGPLAAFEALAIDDYVRKAQIPVISPSAAAEDLTQRKPNPWFVRAVGTSAQPSHAMGDYAAKELKYKNVTIIADDFAFGHEISAGFQRTFEEAGGRVIQKLWSPLNVADYGNYISQINPKADAVFAAFAGGNGVKFLKQYAEYGMKGKLPVIASMTTVDEGILKNMGEEAVGVVSSGWYAAGIDNPANKALVASMQKEYKDDPGYYSMGAYNAGLVLEAALKATKGNVDDKNAFMKALRSVNIPNDPLGSFKLDAYGNPVMNIYVRKVERKNGRLTNTVLKTYPAVSQFWTYNEKDFLANPVYSRDWPPAKHLDK